MFRRWHRVAALFILLWAVVDMSVPSLCEADGDFLPVPQQHASVSVDSVNGLRPSVPASEDDCFCCSSHVSPTRNFEFSEVAVVGEYAVAAPQTRLLDFAEPHYHPPRA